MAPCLRYPTRLRACAAGILISTLGAAIGVPAAQAGPSRVYQYLSPLPDAQFVPPSHNIVIREGRSIDPNTVDAVSLSVLGSASGRHSGSFVLSDDRKTLVFTPDAPFSPGEVVRVRLDSGPRTAAGTALPPLAFDFTVSPSDLVRGRAVPLATPPASIPTSSSPRYSLPGREGVSHAPMAAASDLPPGYPALYVISSDNPEPGEIFLTPFGFSAPPPPATRGPMVIVDNLGMPLYYHPLTLGGLTLTPQQGKLTYWDQQRDKFMVMDSSYAVVDSFWAKNGYFNDHHDLQLLPNGHALITAGENRPVGMDTVITGGDPDALVEGAVVQELDLAKNVVFEWRSLDYIDILDGDPKSVNFLAPLVKYFVINAIELDHDGNILISGRYINQIIKVDRQTGEVIWRFGANGNHNSFTIVGDSRGFSHQHDCRRLSNGHITLYDNGNWLQPLKSRALEYELDEVGMVATLVWEHTDLPNRYGNFMGNVQRRESGGTMIGWGGSQQQPIITDLHEDGSTAFELGWTHPAGNYGTYRAFRAPWRTNRFTTDVDTLDFGAIQFGDSATLSITISSHWGSDVMITSFVSTEPAFYVVDPVPISIVPEGSATVDVRFKPDAKQAFEGRLYVRSVSDTELVAQRVELRGVGEDLTPTQLALLVAEWREEGVLVRWRFAVPEDFSGVILQRSERESGPWSVVQGELLEDYGAVGMLDRDVSPGRDYFYRLAASTRDGEPWTSETIVVAGRSVGGEFALLGVTPCPSRGPTQIGFAVARESRVRLSVLDLQGRVVAVLADGVYPPGRHQAVWSAGDAEHRVPAGLYFVRFEWPGNDSVRRLVLTP